MYHCENIIFFLSYFKLYQKTWDRNSPFHSDNVYLKSSYFFFFLKSFPFGTDLHQKWLPLHMYFPFPVRGKIFLYSILIFSTFWSIVHIKYSAVAPYRITNICSLLPVTVMVLLCVNATATVCDSLCLLGSSTDWAVDVICDRARKPFWHVAPFARFSYMIDNQLCQDRLGFFFVYCNRSTRGRQNYRSLYLNLHIFL